MGIEIEYPLGYDISGNSLLRDNGTSMTAAHSFAMNSSPHLAVPRRASSAESAERNFLTSFDRDNTTCLSTSLER